MTSILNSTNLLKLAMSVIPPRKIQYISFNRGEVNGAGELVNIYDDPIEINAIVQAEAASVYQEHGLSPQKLHKTVFVNRKIQSTSNQQASDLFCFDGSYWRVISSTDWYQYNGWTSCIVSQMEDSSEVCFVSSLRQEGEND